MCNEFLSFNWSQLSFVSWFVCLLIQLQERIALPLLTLPCPHSVVQANLSFELFNSGATYSPWVFHVGSPHKSHVLLFWRWSDQALFIIKSKILIWTESYLFSDSHIGFSFTGLYYHLSKRAAGIRYVFIGKPTNQRPRYTCSTKCYALSKGTNFSKGDILYFHPTFWLWKLRIWYLWSVCWNYIS